MKDLKDEMKAFQKEIKELRNEPQKAMEVQKRSMKVNMKYMSHSMRSTLFTFIPIILIFGWMNSHLSYDPILPGQDFTTTVVVGKGISGEVELNVPEGLSIEGSAVKEAEDSEVKWVLNGKEGEYLLEYVFNNQKYTKDVLITEGNGYASPIKDVKDGNIEVIKIDNKKNLVLNLFGWEIGWLGAYIIFSLIFSILLRKMMKIY